MITLFTFPEAFGLRNVSPFCLKVEMALAHLNIDFEIALESDPRKGPKDKLPFIITEDGTRLADSELILDHLDKISDGGLYGQLTAQEIAVGTAFIRLADDHLYWIVVASRWLEDDWFPNIRDGFFGSLPPLVGPVISRLARSQIRKTYNLHGLGRHSREEQEWFLRRNLQAIENQVSNGQCIAGQRLTVFDFGVASLLAGMLDNKPDTWVTVIAREYPALVEYTERVQKEIDVFGRVLS